MHAWLDVRAGVAGDMLMGALVDAGADVAAVEKAARAVAGDGVRLRREQVLRAGLPATKIHVELIAGQGGPRTLPWLRDQVERAALADRTKELALRVFHRLGEGYGRGYGMRPDEVTLHEVAALDMLTDVVGDCEALRLLGVDSITASPLALGSGRIRTSHGDLEVPVPAVAELAKGWPITTPDGGALAGSARRAEPQSPDDTVDGNVPSGGISGDRGLLTEEPAELVGDNGLGDLATPTGTALLRCFAQVCEPAPPVSPVRIGVGAGGRDTPGRPNVVRVLLH